MSYQIKKVAVLGAGVMGSGIAAHLAGARIPSVLLDIVPRELTDKEKEKGLTLESKEVRNRFALSGIENIAKSKPKLCYHDSLLSLIEPGNFDDDMGKIADCDWIIEVVVENLSIKQSLFKKIEQHRKAGSIVTSNTSGLSLKSMAEGMSEDFQQHFMVTHFFNPVRYMRLLELVVGEKTKKEVVDTLVIFGRDRLGKSIVFGKDTPNFIANRIGIHGIMAILHLMVEKGYTIEEIDSVFGPAMGRARSAVFKTADLVGLDTFAHVAQNCYDNLPDDDEREVFKLPDFINKMLEKKWLGRKAESGFYKKVGKDIHVLDLTEMEYHPQEKFRADSLGEARKIADVGERIKTVVTATDMAGEIAWEAVAKALPYTVKRIGEIADDIVNIDRAMRYGFNWEIGPFETWDAVGVKYIVDRLEKEGKPVPAKVKTLLEKGDGTFYRKQKGKLQYFDFKTNTYKDAPEVPKLVLLKDLKEEKKVIAQNPSASLIDLGDGVTCLEFHSKMNSIDDDIVRMIFQGLEETEKNHKAMIIANQADHFSVGANLFLLWSEAQQKNWDNIEKIVKAFQDANQAIKYSPIPVVAVPFGMALGGGCEVTIAANGINASAELYMGLVEVGVGLIPGGGGTKELLRRLMVNIPGDMDIDRFGFIRKAFENIGMAKVSMSAEEARHLGYLGEMDRISINPDTLMADAKHMALSMANSGWIAPLPKKDFKLPGESALGAIDAFLYQMKLSGWISDYDGYIGRKLAGVLTGGKASPNKLVGEQYILDLEREAFMSLVGEEKSMDRMQYMLQNNKPLRN